MKVLTPRRRAILEAIRRNGRSPSLQELGRAVGLSAKSSVFYEIEKLRYHRYVTRDEGQRTLTLTDKGLLAAQGFELIYTCDQDGIKLA